MIHVIVPSYNCPDALHGCLSSIKIQLHTDYNVVMIDDASTNPQHVEMLDHWHTTEGWTLIRNNRNMKAPYTLKQGIEASGAAEGDIIFILDGDDMILDTALGYIANVYARYPQLWFTYGSYQVYPEWTNEPAVSEYPTLIRWERDFRYDRTRVNHPITFRRFLFDALDDADLQDDDGHWFRDAYDQIISVPMLEMATDAHYAYLTEIIYLYNATNPLSEAKLVQNGALVPRSPQLRDRPKKEPLQR